MKITLAFGTLVVASLGQNVGIEAFQSLSNGLRLKKTQTQPAAISTFLEFENRRNFLIGVVGGMAATLIFPAVAEASDEEGMTTKMFNPDGSLKDTDVETEARFRDVEFQFDASDYAAVNVDGVNTATSSNQGSAVNIQYQLPMKWASGTGADEIYVDRSEGVNGRACRRIVVYRAPGKTTIERLEKASTVGIATSLEAIDGLKQLAAADLISGRALNQDGQKHFEFDMAVAPATCEKSKEDLGLGFCPYDSIYLLSATVLDDHLYVFAIEADKAQWKRASSDLKLVRSSFTVSSA